MIEYFSQPLWLFIHSNDRWCFKEFNFWISFNKPSGLPFVRQEIDRSLLYIVYHEGVINADQIFRRSIVFRPTCRSIGQLFQTDIDVIFFT